VRDDEIGGKEDHQIIHFVLPLLAFCLAGEEEEEEEKEENMLQDTYKREVMVMVRVAKTKETTQTKPQTKKRYTNNRTQTHTCFPLPRHRPKTIRASDTYVL